MNKDKFIANLVLLGFKEAPITITETYTRIKFINKDIEVLVVTLRSSLSYVRVRVKKLPVIDTIKDGFQDSLAKIIEHLNK